MSQDKNSELSPRPRLINQVIFAILGIFIGFVVWLYVPGGENPKAPLMAGIISLMAVWWIFEVIPIATTAALPLFLLPLFQIATPLETIDFYLDEIMLLFLGGLLLAVGLQESGVHRRIAFQIVRRIGSKPSSLILGFMVATGFVSMWISNTASVMVMMPVALSVLEEAKHYGLPEKERLRFGACLMLSIAYAADIGGMMTLIGTPPNMVAAKIIRESFPDAPQIGFMDWLKMGLPLGILFMTSGWLVMTRLIFPMPKTGFMGGKEIIDGEIRKLGPVKRDEKMAGGIFLFAALLWVFGEDMDFGGNFVVPGWRGITGLTDLSDAWVAIIAASLLFILPSQKNLKWPLLNWRVIYLMPWGVMLLFGSGFAIAGGFKSSGLSAVTEASFAGMSVSSPLLMVFIVCLTLIVLTEFTSNTAITNLTLPILASVAVAMQFDPRLLMIPATLSASCGFMMPIASPTQAIVFGSGYVRMRQMARAGIWFNLLGLIIVTLVFMLVGTWALGIDPLVMPEWARRVPG